MMTRRHFLQIGARSAALLSGGVGLLRLARIHALAQPTGDYRALVCVFLHGGNDANNMIVPLASEAYQAYATARAGLALPEATLLPVAAAGGDLYGLHPQLAPLGPLFEERRLAVVANVGMLVQALTREEYRQRTAPLPRNLYSHIDQQIAWQTARPDGDPTTGWAGRAADRLSAHAPAAFPTVVSMAGRPVFGNGLTSVPATISLGAPIGLAGVDGSAVSQARLESFEELLALDSGAVLVGSANETTREGLRQAGLLKAALAASAPLPTPFPASSLGAQLQEVAKVIGARQALGAQRQIFFCSLGGFDTHAGQLAQHARLLGELGEAVAAFCDATVALGVDRQVTTFTLSEFGRTLQPTSASGTDHAWGSHHLVLGGAVLGGDVFGRFPLLALGGPDDVGDRGIWLPTVSVDQYGATLASWFGIGPADMPSIFPNIDNFPNPTLGFLA